MADDQRDVSIIYGGQCKNKPGDRPLPLVLLVPLLLLAVPVVELAVMVAVAGKIGILATVGLQVLLSILGAGIARRQGLAAFARLRATVDRRQPPVAEVIDGACILVAGVLLVIPGFVSDALGGLLLLPPVRAGIYKAVARRVEVRTFGGTRPGGPSPDAPGRSSGGGVIEGEYEEIEPPREPKRPTGGWRPR